ncbi:MAG: hypothetical protein AB7K09_09260 [Planctomycetota bacterium]
MPEPIDLPYLQRNYRRYTRKLATPPAVGYAMAGVSWVATAAVLVAVKPHMHVAIPVFLLSGFPALVWAAVLTGNPNTGLKPALARVVDCDIRGTFVVLSLRVEHPWEWLDEQSAAWARTHSGPVKAQLVVPNEQLAGVELAGQEEVPVLLAGGRLLAEPGWALRAGLAHRIPLMPVPRRPHRVERVTIAGIIPPAYWNEQAAERQRLASVR